MDCPTDYNQVCVPVQSFQYFGSKVLKKTDRLGSVRAVCDTQWPFLWQDTSYYPYGEEKDNPQPDGTMKFATYLRDGAGLDYAMGRYYSSTVGRFYTPDPSGSVNPGAPSSWNRYAYVQGDPVSFNDSTGLNLPDPDGRLCGFNGAGCGGSGGGGLSRMFITWFWGGEDYVPVISVVGGPPESPGDPGAGDGALLKIGPGVVVGSSIPSIGDSRGRVEGLLRDPGCAMAIGAASVDAAEKTAQSIYISYGQMSLPGYSQLPYFTVDANGRLSGGQLGGQYNLGDITLNSAVNWADPSHQAAINPQGQAVTVALGIPGVQDAPTAQQFMDLYVLHELAHSFGLTHPGIVDQPGTTNAFYNEAIWNSSLVSG
jgi:RHS repeat-associated protein